MNLRILHNSWLRSSSVFTAAHSSLEAELRRMKERNLRQEFIDKKDEQIEQFVDFFNQTEELIHAYQLTLTQARIENHFLTEMLAKKISLAELMEYKPSKKAEILNLETGDIKTLTELNGQN